MAAKAKKAPMKINLKIKISKKMPKTTRKELEAYVLENTAKGNDIDGCGSLKFLRFSNYDMMEFILFVEMDLGGTWERSKYGYIQVLDKSGRFPAGEYGVEELGAMLEAPDEDQLLHHPHGIQVLRAMLTQIELVAGRALDGLFIKFVSTDAGSGHAFHQDAVVIIPCSTCVFLCLFMHVSLSDCRPSQSGGAWAKSISCGILHREVDRLGCFHFA
jgi:hypothetical protein